MIHRKNRETDRLRATRIEYPTPHRCPKCFESVTMIQPQYKGTEKLILYVVQLTGAGHHSMKNHSV